MNESEKNDHSEFLLERYKYILSQKRDLNDRTFKIASVFQALVLVIASGQYKILLDISSKSISADRGIAVSWTIFLFLCLASVCYITLLVGGLYSWLKYRSDEAKIELLVFGNPRPNPTILDCFRWYETYLILAGILAPAVHFFALHSTVFDIPLK
ncbi:hypothetical protein [Sphingomonas sp. NIBR02145]|uniref:hypothetical protein n=1 Tax=Sphingomonas sp. NIBR02145 TaxID=3014784 RepID=UPI0022B3B27C|nr:hypothetical protein [Sphingomonas sp. NIBR02145]WHU02596.1 hypothetical protein O3305_20840 [Sphingomonas sp. NIBR02145]